MSDCDPMSSAWVYLFLHGDATVGDVRKLNAKSLHSWTLSLLFALLDIEVDVSAESSVTLRAKIKNVSGAVSDVIEVESGDCVRYVAETLDGVFVVLKGPAK